MHTHAQRKKLEQTEQTVSASSVLPERTIISSAVVGMAGVPQSEVQAFEHASPAQPRPIGHHFARISVFSDAELASG